MEFAPPASSVCQVLVAEPVTAPSDSCSVGSRLKGAEAFRNWGFCRVTVQGTGREAWPAGTDDQACVAASAGCRGTAVCMRVSAARPSRALGGELWPAETDGQVCVAASAGRLMLVEVLRAGPSAGGLSTALCEREAACRADQDVCGRPQWGLSQSDCPGIHRPMQHPCCLCVECCCVCLLPLSPSYPGRLRPSIKTRLSSEMGMAHPGSGPKLSRGPDLVIISC